MHVVLVEDEAQLCGMGEALLLARDHAVAAFTSAEAAAAWCDDAQNPVDAVLIDLHRHGAGAGLHLAERIAKARPDARITATTGVIEAVPARLPANIRMLPRSVRVATFYDLGDGVS